METVYVDVLIVLNIYANYFLLRIAAAMTGSPLRRKRCAAASVYGSLYSLLIFAPELPYAIVTAIKSAAAFTIVALAFGYSGRARFLKDTAAFFASNFILAGFAQALYSWLEPDFVHIGNTCFYADFSLLLLIISTAALYIVASLIRRLAFGAGGSGEYKVVVRYKGRLVELAGLADTGNGLSDFFTGLPVIICDPENFVGEEELSGERLPKGFRLTPSGTISGSGLTPVFRPEETTIIDAASGERKPVDVMIGLGKSSGRAIFNPALLKR